MRAWPHAILVCMMNVTTAMCSAPPSLVRCASVTTLDFFGSCATLGAPSQSNLGGLGPDSGAEELRFPRIAVQSSGVAIDLVITVASGSTYQGTPTANGCFNSNQYMKLSVARSRSVTFDFTLRDAAINAPVTLTAFNLVALDIDQQSTSIREVISVSGHAAYDLDASTHLTVGGTASTPTFTSTQRNVDNPTDPRALTTAQQRSSVYFFFADTSTWQMTFSA